MLNIYIILSVNRIDISVFNALSNLNRHFLPFRRADLTVSASLRPIRSGRPQLHGSTPRIYGNLDS